MYITKEEALEKLNITTVRSLNRYVKKGLIRTQSEAKTKPTLYSLEDIENLHKSEPTPTKPSINDPFDILDDVGKKEFDKLESILTDQGLYKPMDRAALLTYAYAYQNFIGIAIRLQNEGDVITVLGTKKINPLHKVFMDFSNMMSSTGRMLGIGVINRKGLKIEEKQEENHFADFI